MDAELLNLNFCKHCQQVVELLNDEGLQCVKCGNWVHLRCLIKGTVPGGLTGDVFYTFTCEKCSSSCGLETFLREKMPWFQAITLTLHHMSVKSPALARKGFFHWKTHIAAFIDKYWDTLFPKEFKRKKKWMGTVSGTLSVYSPHFFLSGTSIFKEQGWWTLAMPKLTPAALVQINSEFLIARQKAKEQKLLIDELTILNDIFTKKPYPKECFEAISFVEITNLAQGQQDQPLADTSSINEVQLTDFNNQTNAKNKKKTHNVNKKENKNKKRLLLPTLDNFQEAPSKKLFKEFNVVKPVVNDVNLEEENNDGEIANKEIVKEAVTIKHKDPFCHYNTCLKDTSMLSSLNLKMKLLGGVREELVYSPYSALFLKPFIRRDVSTTPPWLQLMAELMLTSNLLMNGCDKNYELPPRAPLDYVYVQPEHIPAVNSLCNQFFWPGIDMTDILQYPDFSCIAMYKKLVVGFAFIVPDVKFNESYISFVFTRPGWRNVGIAKFMLYHLIQTCAGKDITLHVSTSNSALLLYQKMGFKVERVVLGFYEKYMRNDTRESKDAFLCRLER